MDSIREYAPHQVRVIEEAKELNDKITKLTLFTKGDVFKKLDSIDQSHLNDQLSVMTDYMHILERRIARF